MRLRRPELYLFAAALVLLVLTVVHLSLSSGRRSIPAFVPLPAPAAEGRLNINEASAPELMELPGIGETLSQAILTRRADGLLRGPDDLMSVPGIGPATVNNMETYITYGGVLP